MRVIFVPHWSFFDGEIPGKNWFELLSTKFKERGHTLKLFEMEADKLSDYEIVHVLSRSDPEMWASLSQFRKIVVVTPGIFLKSPAAELTRGKWGSKILRWVRLVLQRSINPVDDFSWYQSPDGYLVSSEKWKNYLVNRWNVPSAEIGLFELPSANESDLEKAVDSLLAYYLKILTSKKSEASH